jgi:DNA polymerase III subunit epsilon
LLDAELTARVYLELVGGRQAHLKLAPRDGDIDTAVQIARARPHPLASPITAEEQEAHDIFIAKDLGSDPVWNWN